MHLKSWAIVHKISILQISRSVYRYCRITCNRFSLDYLPTTVFNLCLCISGIPIYNKINPFHSLTTICQCNLIISTNIHARYTAVMRHHPTSDFQQIITAKFWLKILSTCYNITPLPDNPLQHLPELLRSHMW